MTRFAPVKEISIEKDGRFCVFPDISVCGDFEFIWRAASGIRWDAAIDALFGYEPHRWEPLTLYGQITTSVKSEYGVQLYLTPNTSWRGVNGTLKQQIESWSSANP